MKLENAEHIVEMGVSDGLDVELHEDYNGRGMHGDTTAGVVCNNHGEFAAMVARSVCEIVQSNNNGKSDLLVDDLITDLMRLRTDHMGRSSIILY